MAKIATGSNNGFHLEIQSETGDAHVTLTGHPAERSIRDVLNGALALIVRIINHDKTATMPDAAPIAQIDGSCNDAAT